MRQDERVDAEFGHPVPDPCAAVPSLSAKDRCLRQHRLAVTLGTFTSAPRSRRSSLALLVSLPWDRCRRRLGGLHRASRVIARACERGRLHMVETEAAGRSEPISSNSSGVHQRATGTWLALGRRYWPSVTILTPTPLRSTQSASHLVRLFSHAEDHARFRHKACLTRSGQHREAAGVTRRRPDCPLQPSDGLEVVVENLRPRVENQSRGTLASPLQSGMSNSTEVPGQRSLIALTVAANPAAPPSARSSRATAVTTACARPILEPLLRRAPAHQDRQARSTGVHETETASPRASSPLIMKVAVPSDQHS